MHFLIFIVLVEMTVLCVVLHAGAMTSSAIRS